MPHAGDICTLGVIFRVLRRYTLFALALLTLTVCCAPLNGPLNGPLTPPIYDAPASLLTMHGDVSFTPRQRAIVEQAMRRLHDESRGLLEATIAWDLDFDDMSSVEAHKSDDVMLALTSDSDAVQSIETAPGATLLGITVQGRPPYNSDAITVVLVTDRLGSDTLFLSVAMHELLHAFGLGHVRDPGALMHWSVSSFPTTCMHEADVEELCRVYGCEVRRIGWCE